MGVGGAGLKWAADKLTPPQGLPAPCLKLIGFRHGALQQHATTAITPTTMARSPSESPWIPNMFRGELASREADQGQRSPLNIFGLRNMSSLHCLDGACWWLTEVSDCLIPPGDFASEAPRFPIALEPIWHAQDLDV